MSKVLATRCMTGCVHTASCTTVVIQLAVKCKHHVTVLLQQPTNAPYLTIELLLEHPHFCTKFYDAASNWQW